MADRFPSLDQIDAGQTEPQGDASFEVVGESADTSDFLSRERALLGDDADQFATPNDNAATVEDAGDDDEDDLLGGGDDGGGFGQQQQTGGGGGGGSDMAEFESSFPAIDASNEQMAPGGTLTGSAAPFVPGQSSSFTPSYNEPDEEEPEVIKEWREKRDAAIQHRDEVSANRKAETVKAAHEAIDDFYENYNNKKEKTVAQTRKEAEEFLANRENTVAGGTSWERIAKLVDLSDKSARATGGGAGKERFREMLISLKKDEKAPGATGY